MKSVLICIPNYGMVHTDFMLSLVGVLGFPLQDVRTLVASKQSCRVDMNRNFLAQGILDTGFDYGLWLDSDMTFPVDTLARLLAHDKDIVGCAYPNRHHIGSTVGARQDKAPLERDGLVKADYLGFGCVLIKRDVFQKMSKPWFAPQYRAGEVIPVGGDVAFCRSAEVAGFETWLDQSLSHEIGHLGTTRLSLPNGE